MATLSQLADSVQQRLEEVAGSAGTFWSRQYEIYPAIVEACNEAALVTGSVQVVSQQVTLPTNVNFIDMPQGWLAILTIRGPQAVRKSEIFALDKLIGSWQGVGGSTANPPVVQISAWAPVGFTQYAIYPMLSYAQSVLITALSYPFMETPPYTGNEVIPFQQEYFDGIEGYAASILRYKESGLEMEEATSSYQEFLSAMQAMSLWMNRKDTLVFSRSVGAPVRPTPVEIR